MNKGQFNARALTMEVSDLISKRQFEAARTLLLEELKAGPSLSKRRRIHLLNNLAGVEVVAGQPRQALKALEERRALGYSRRNEKLDDHLQTAKLLAQSEQWVEARAELIDLLTRGDGCRQWSGMLPALELYFDLEAACRSYLEPKIEAAYEASILKLGVAGSITRGDAALETKVRCARKAYRAAAVRFQKLLLRSYTEINNRGRTGLLRDLHKFISCEKVGFFNDQARELLSRVSKQASKKPGGNPTEP
jgi:hypothetical protein